MAAPADESPSKASASIYLTVRRRYPDLVAVRLRKWVLEGLSRVVEREILARAHQPVLFGAFQRESHFRQSQEHWHMLGGTARIVVVFADGFAEDDGATTASADLIVRAPLGPEAPLRQEWAVVCDDDRFSVVVSAWEVPGQEDQVDSERLFETVWSFEEGPVRSASRMCLALAAQAGAPGADRLMEELRGDPPAGAGVRTVSNVLAEVLAEVGAARTS